MSLTTLANTFAAAISGTTTKAEELSTLTDVISKSMSVTFAKGTGANQANGLFHDTRPLADGANETLEFTDSSLTDKLGEAIDFSKLKALAIKNNSDDSTLIIGAAAATQMAIFGGGTETIILQPGGVFMFICADASGLDVSTNAALKLEHGGEGTDAPDYDIIALGVQT